MSFMIHKNSSDQIKRLSIQPKTTQTSFFLHVQLTQSSIHFFQVNMCILYLEKAKIDY